MNELAQIFNYEGSQVRTIERGNEAWFVARDVCGILELNTDNINKVLNRLDEDEKDRISIPTPGGIQTMSVVNESGLYNLIFTSRKDEAKKFKKWVTNEVLPSIRQNGMYATDEVAKQLEQMNRRFDELEKKVQQLQKLPAPKNKVMRQGDEAHLETIAQIIDYTLAGDLSALGKQHPKGAKITKLANGEYLLSVDTIWIYAAYEELTDETITLNQANRLAKLFFRYPDNQDVSSWRTTATIDGELKKTLGKKRIHTYVFEIHAKKAEEMVAQYRY